MALVPATLQSGFAAMVATKPATAKDACDQIADFYYAYATKAQAGAAVPTLLPAAKTLFSKNLQAALAISPPDGTPAKAAAAFVVAVNAFWLTPPVVFGAGAATAFTGAAALQTALQDLFSAFNTAEVVSQGIATALDTATKTVAAVIPPSTSPVTLT